MSVVTDMALPRVRVWTNGDDHVYPQGFENVDDARNFIRHDPSHDFEGEDLVDDARGFWSRGMRGPGFIEPRIVSNGDMRAALGEAYLDRFGMKGLEGTMTAVDNMLFKRPGLMRGAMERALMRGVDVQSQVLMEQLASQEQWPWMNQVYAAGARDLARVTQMDDWEPSDAAALMDRFGRWQVARESALK